MAETPQRPAQAEGRNQPPQKPAPPEGWPNDGNKGQQPAHQPAVVGLSEDVFFVHYDAASSSSSNCFR